VKPKRSARRKVFVLTPEEKRTVSCVLIAFLLGVGAKYYRKIHAIPPRQLAIADTANTVGLTAQKRADAKRRKSAK